MLRPLDERPPPGRDPTPAAGDGGRIKDLDGVAAENIVTARSITVPAFRPLDWWQIDELAAGRQRLRLRRDLLEELGVNYSDESTWPPYPQLLEDAA